MRSAIPVYNGIENIIVKIISSNVHKNIILLSSNFDFVRPLFSKFGATTGNMKSSQYILPKITFYLLLNEIRIM